MGAQGLHLELLSVIFTNGVESCKAPASAVKQKKARGKNAKIGSNPRCELTEEEKQKANAWARERIERVQFSGKDMEVLKAKIAEEGKHGGANGDEEEEPQHWKEDPCGN